MAADRRGLRTDEGVAVLDAYIKTTGLPSRSLSAHTLLDLGAGACQRG
jgi:hypothetical protein